VYYLFDGFILNSLVFEFKFCIPEVLFVHENNESTEYHIGAKIVHPKYGGATINDIEEKDVDGQSKLYYVLGVLGNGLTVSVPANSNKLNFRPVHAKSELEEIIAKADFSSIKSTKSKNWTEIYNKNLERLKSGDLKEVASVFKYLVDKETLQTLSTTEKRMMSSAKQIIASEIMLSFDIENKLDAETKLMQLISDGNKKPN